MIHLTEKDYAVSRWSGGTTTQIALFPPESSYAGRDFLWRVSSAVVEDGESAFTPLPDYDRHLMLLEGSLLLRHDGGEPLPLDPYQPHAFDGGAETVSVGRCRDFNLMLRKGKCRGGVHPPARPRGWPGAHRPAALLRPGLRLGRFGRRTRPPRGGGVRDRLRRGRPPPGLPGARGRGGGGGVVLSRLRRYALPPKLTGTSRMPPPRGAGGPGRFSAHVPLSRTS